MQRANYVLGNPPFVGAKYMNDGQRADVGAVFAGIDGAGLLDLVAAWYVKAARYLEACTTAHPPRVAFVSTNSIRDEPHALVVHNINPYLVEGGDVVLPRRSETIS